MSSAFFEFSIGSPGQIDRMMKETVEFTRAAKITQRQARRLVEYVAKRQVGKIKKRVLEGKTIDGHPFRRLAHSTTQASKPRPKLGATTISKAVRGSGNILHQTGRGFLPYLQYRMIKMKNSSNREVNTHAVIDVANVMNKDGKNARAIATVLNFGHNYPAMTAANLKNSRYFRLPFPKTISLRRADAKRGKVWDHFGESTALRRYAGKQFEPRQGRRLRRSKKKFVKNTRGLYTTKIGPRILPSREFFGISDEETVEILRVFMYYFVHRKYLPY